MASLAGSLQRRLFDRAGHLPPITPIIQAPPKRRYFARSPGAHQGTEGSHAGGGPSCRHGASCQRAYIGKSALRPFSSP